MPRNDLHEDIDFDNQDDFSFSFEIGLAPAIDIDFSEKDKVTRYEIAVDDKMKNDYLDNYRRRYGDLRKADEIVEKDIVKGSITAIDENGNPLEKGPSVDMTSIGIDIIADKDIKESFIGKKEGDTLDFDLRKAYPNDTEIAGLLSIKKDEATKIEGNFRFTVKEISRFYPAEVNQELFNKVYGEGVVNSEEEFMKKIEEEIASNLKKESEYKLMLDIKDLALNKIDIKLPEEFLKKWLLNVNEKTTAEQIDKEFDSFRKDLKWQLIRNKIAKNSEVKVSEEDLLQEAANITRYQFQQYGLFYATDEQINNYAKETLKREEDAKRIADKVVEDKVISIIKDKISKEEKTISAEEFNKLFE
jgi:trigger factor